MSTNPSTKLFWNDWDNDRALALCSFAAQGLWMRMLSLAARSGGYIRVHGKPCSVEDIAVLVGHPVSEVSPLVEELAARGVFSRARDGSIYNRRMVRDEKNRKISQKNGKKGGNPVLLISGGNKTKKSSPLNPEDKAKLNGDGLEGGSPPIPYTPIPKKDSEDSDESSAARAATEVDPTKQIFDRGVAILGPKRRGLLGKLCKQHGEPAVLEAIVACEDARPVEPAAYLLGCLARAGPQINGHHRPSPVENLALGAMRAAAKFDAIDAEHRDRGADFPPAPALLDRRRSSGD